jgi:ssDNA-binding Zn-finger/Zn-ribbon topoisomerase 1
VILAPPTPCEDCRQPIPAERLRAVPGARRCLECQIQAELDPPRRLEGCCPRCGGRLVWRTRREGRGVFLVGCANFPLCRHVALQCG